MIEKIQKKFFRIALLALTIAMVLVTAAANTANWINVRVELNKTLEAVSNAGKKGGQDKEGQGKQGGGRSKHWKNLVSESQYYIITVEEDGGLTLVNQKMLENQAVDEEAVLTLAADILAGGRASGFLQDYLFARTTEENGQERLVMLNCETRLAGVRRLLLFSAAACLAGILIAWILVARLSRRAIRPFEDNLNRQKRFITDAGHELKTPLTVISANMDVLSLDDPENPWVESTKKQTVRLRKLVEELVYLSRMEEADTPLALQEQSLKTLIEECAGPFQAMAELKGQELTVSVPEDLKLTCDSAAVSRMISILCDNAVKYAPEDSKIFLSAKEEGKNIWILTENETVEPLTVEACTHLFDRFYRADPSRSKEDRAGFGIGLAIAAAVAEKHGGSSEAALTDDGRLRLSFRFPKPQT